MSLVVAIFLFGLAAGAFFGAQLSQVVRRPGVAYGLLEAFIGVSAFLLAYIIPAWPHWLSSIGGTHWSDSTWLLVKCFSIIVLIGSPTLAMGMTFPLLIQLFATDQASVQNKVSHLYSINTFGAVAGAAGAGFLFVPWLGTLYTNHLMVVINLGLFLIAVKEGLKSPWTISREQKTLWPSFQLDSLLLLISTFAIGGVAIGAEVAWSKYLTLFLGSNIYGVSLILSLFLLGIALGALFLSRIPIKVSKLKVFLWLFAFAILSTLFASLGLNHAPLWARFFSTLPPLLSKAFVVFILLLPATLSFGALLPLTIDLLSRSSADSASWGGLVYASNTMGGLVGSLTVGLFLIPNYGTGSTLWWLCLALTLIFFIFVVRLVVNNQLLWSGPLLLAILGWILITQPNAGFINLVQTAEYSYSNPQASRQEFLSYLNSVQGNIRYVAEGENSVISLHYQTDNEGNLDTQKLILKSNGLAESFFDLQNPGVVPRYEGLLALVPFLYTREPRKAFVIGYGGGYTAEVLSSLNLQQVLVSEIEDEVLNASEAAYLGPNPLLQRRNLQVKIEDARFLLARSPNQQFDIITSQPSHSWMSGVSHLFTQDFFRLVHSKLHTDGVYAQWLNLYNMDTLTLKSLIRSFFNVFEHGAIYTHTGDDQLILVGSASPLQLQYGRLKALTTESYWRERLLHIPFQDEWDFLSNFSMDREKALHLAADAPINTDRNAFAEARQSRLFYSTNTNSDSLDAFLNQHFHTTQKASKTFWKHLFETTQ